MVSPRAVVRREVVRAACPKDRLGRCRQVLVPDHMVPETRFRYGPAGLPPLTAAGLRARLSSAEL